MPALAAEATGQMPQVVHCHVRSSANLSGCLHGVRGALADLIVEADLGRPHIVAPDVGTSAALFAAAAYPERVATVLVGTGGAAVRSSLESR